ncbi:right-handed parallel beta-helix repeat-containing protein [Actinocorallia longicatena]
MISAGAWAALVSMGGAEAAPCPCGKVVSYVDCGAADGGTGSKDKPFDRLTDIAAVKYGPGSEIRLARGATCKGTLAFLGSGSEADPIQVTAYGDPGKAAAIDADGGEQAVKLTDQAYVTVSDLDLTAPGDGTQPRRGVYVVGKDSGTLRGITLTRLDVHDVKGALPAKTQIATSGSEAAGSGGILLEAQGTTRPTAFDGVVVSGNRLRSVDRDGIALWSNWCRKPDLAPDWKPTCTEAWKPARNVVVQDNVLTGVAGDGVSVNAAEGAKVRGNTVQGFSERAPGGKGVAVEGSTGTLVTANEVSGGKGTDGGLAFGIGGATSGTALESNVSHDNGGGFAELAGSKTAPLEDFSIQGNLSVNDAARGLSIPGGPLRKGRVVGNTVHLDPPVSQLLVDAKDGTGLDVAYVDNLVTRTAPKVVDGQPQEKGTVGWNLDAKDFVVDRNLLSGVPIPDGATGTVGGDPLLLAAGATDPLAYQLRPGSPSLGAGEPLPGLTGLPVGPSRVPAGTPNLGAVQAPAAYPAGLAATFNADEPGDPAGWRAKGDVKVAPDPAGFTGNSMVFGPESSATRDFPAGAGFLRAAARLWTSAPDAPVLFQLTDADGVPVASIGVRDGSLTYTDDADGRVLPYPVPTGTWIRVGMLLRPETGTYDVTVGGTTLATADMRSDAGIASRLVIGAGKGAKLAADDILVFPESCPGPGLAPGLRPVTLPHDAHT